ncbi:hypothetical protein [Cysteiniphilum marinum]|uniref:hypothetical protein n=2 Tax=Cysteiniphilum marinum TaxID=2774191 RepID=UPI0019396FEB|nr:hypothetical protein [Cysteiniphilum marinum]
MRIKRLIRKTSFTLLFVIALILMAALGSYLMNSTGSISQFNSFLKEQFLLLFIIRISVLLIISLFYHFKVQKVIYYLREINAVNAQKRAEISAEKNAEQPKDDNAYKPIKHLLLNKPFIGQWWFCFACLFLLDSVVRLVA